MNEDNFWTDATVKEMIYSRLPIPEHYCGDLQKCLNEFKQQKLNSNKQDWEIVEDYYRDENSYKTIKSVRILSNGEVFSVGDDTNKGKICSFKTNDYYGIIVHCESGNCFYLLQQLQKLKQPLFTADDVSCTKIFEGTIYWIVELPSYNLSKSIGMQGAKRRSNQLYFSTESAAKECIENKKPVITLSELFKVCYRNQEATPHSIYCQLKEIVEQKMKVNG